MQILSQRTWWINLVIFWFGSQKILRQVFEYWQLIWKIISGMENVRKKGEKNKKLDGGRFVLHWKIATRFSSCWDVSFAFTVNYVSTFDYILYLPFFIIRWQDVHEFLILLYFLLDCEFLEKRNKCILISLV